MVEGRGWKVNGTRRTAFGARLTAHDSRRTAHGSWLTIQGTRYKVNRLNAGYDRKVSGFRCQKTEDR
jgi:hypothetical protein